MQVKTWIRKYVSTFYVEDENVRKLLFDNDIYSFYTYKEQILEIDLADIVDTETENSGVGYSYNNRLYDLVHKRSKFYLEKDDLEYEIIEEGYPTDIPYANCEFDNVEEFHKWLLEKGKEEREEE